MIRPGQRVPPLSFPLVGGGTWDVHADRDGYALIEVYRGRHCSICEAHLRGLALLEPQLAQFGTEVVVVSMNDESLAVEARERWELTAMRVGYGLDEATARSWGLYLSTPVRDTEPALFAEPATFVVEGEGRLYAASVRSSPHLRPQLERVLTMMRRATEGYPARGIE